jgi:predicted acylesterase/phospholipase RssA
MTKITKTLFASLLLGASYLSHGVSAAKCYALGLSSGQESAAFQAGALQGLLEKVSADQMKYFTVSGNTGGAVNTVILASHAQG